MSHPKISVVTVSFNAVGFIEETILSVLNQTYPNVEYIIIDGGSTDGTVDIIKKYADRLAYWVSEPDRGIYDAMNKGIAVATGDYINFMNSGDRFYNEKVVSDVFQIKNITDNEIIYGDAIYEYRKFTLLFKPQPLELFDSYFPIYHQATFSKTLLMKENKFNLTYRCSADYDFLFKMYKKQYKFIYTPLIFCRFEAERGLSSTNIELQLNETGEINGLINSDQYRKMIKKTLIKLRLKLFFSKFIPGISSHLRKKSLLRNNYIFEV